MMQCAAQRELGSAGFHAFVFNTAIPRRGTPRKLGQAESKFQVRDAIIWTLLNCRTQYLPESRQLSGWLVAITRGVVIGTAIWHPLQQVMRPRLRDIHRDARFTATHTS